MKESHPQESNPLNVDEVAQSIRDRLHDEGFEADSLSFKAEDTEDEEVSYGPPKPEDGTDKIGNLSKLVDIGDPVILVDPDDEREVWYVDNVTDGEDGMKVTIHYRAADEEKEEIRMVSWEDITPRYNDPEMYIKKIRQYRKALEKARDDGNDRVRWQLGQLLEQLTHFARIYSQKSED